MKKLLLVALLLLTASCAEYQQQKAFQEYQQGLRLANSKAEQAQKICAINHPKPIENATCRNDTISAAYREANYPYMDLINATNAKRSEIAERVEAKKITAAQGKLELAEYGNSKIEIAHQRDMQVQQAQSEDQQRRAQAAAAFLASGGIRTYQPMQAYQMPVRRPMNCNSYMMGNNINTNCY